MSIPVSVTARPAGAVREQSEWRRAWERFKGNRPAIVGLAVIAFLTMVAMFPDLFAPYSPIAGALGTRGEAPSPTHPFGVDQVGRDVLSRIVHGTRIAMLVGLSATTISLAIGVSVGVVAGYFRGAPEALLMRVVDALQAFPILVLLIAIAAAVGPSLLNVVIIIGLTTWAQYSRVVRAEVLSLREREFVFAARATGVPNERIIVRHLLPNVLGPIVVLGSLSVAGVILLESALSFLGLGAQPPTPSWGAMLTDGRTYLLSYPHIAFFPGVAITVTVLAFNLLGDGLRDALDPRAGS